MKKTNNGFGFIGMFIVILAFAAAGGVGYYVYHRNQDMKTSSNVYNNTGTISSKSGKDTPSKAVQKSFFTCLAEGGTTSKQGPATCTQDRKVYPFPSTFTTDDIINYDKIPAGARKLVVADANDNFDRCVQLATTGNPYTNYPLATVALVSDDFVSVGIHTCDNGHINDYGLDGNTWKFLADRQGAIACDMVSKYDVKQSQVISTSKKGFDECWDSAGHTFPVPE